MEFFVGLLVILAAAFTDGSESTMETITTTTGVAGGTANLPCNVTYPLSSDEASLVLWYHVGQPNPIYILDIRKGGTKHFPAESLKGRIRFYVKSQPPVLVFSPVTRADAGDYKCRVDLRRSRTLILQSRLLVLVPPDVPIIMDEDGQRLQGTVGPYDEGSAITFICDVDGGDPSPSVVWMRDGVLVDGDFNVTRRGFVRNRLKLPAVGRDDLMAEYQCLASNTNLTEPRAASLRLDLNLLPLDVRIDAPNRPLLAAESYNILCQTSGSKPAAITSWWLNGEKITYLARETVDEAENVTSNVLTFVPYPDNHGKVITCKSANPAIPKSTVEASMILDIHFPPIVTLTTSNDSDKLEVIEDEFLLLNCSVRANPWVFKTEWFFSNKVAVTNQSIGVFVDGLTLILKEAKREHSGTYRCSAENSVDRTLSNWLHLTVRYSPKCKYPGLRNLILTDNEAFNLTCEIEADPRDVDFRWTLENALGTINARNWSGSNSVYTYTNPAESKEGYEMLSCWGRNYAGIQRKPCQFKLVTASAPDSPSVCHIGNLTLHSFSLECKPGYNGSLKQEFHLEVYSSSKEFLIQNISSSNHPFFRVKGLSSGTPYILEVYSSNMKGRSGLVPLATATLSLADAAASKDAEHAKLMLRILTAVVAFFCLMFLVSGIFISIRKIKRILQKGSLNGENVTNDSVKKDLSDAPDSNARGPDIIPQSAAESEVFFLSGKTVEEPSLSLLESSPSANVLRKYKHTVL